MTQRALVAYSVGLLGIILVKVLAPGFYAQQNIRTPVKIALFTLVSTQLMNLAFIGPLQHAGLALSIGLAACLNAGLLYWQLRKQRLYLPQPGWAKFLVKLVVAVLAMSAVLLATMHWLPAWEQGHAGAIPAPRPAGGCRSPGLFRYAGAAGFPPARLFRRAVL